jgi:hyperosmotically inducible periplasmic protein
MFNQNFTGASLFLALLLGSAVLTACAIENPPPSLAVIETNESIDSVLNAKVENLLRADVGLAGSQLRVSGGGGAVTVGGTVPDEHSLRRALDLASGVHGVKEIRNAMELVPPK